MDPVPIPPSVSDLERRRLESNIDHDLASLSLSSLPTSTNSHSHSFISTSSSTASANFSLEYPRAETLSFAAQNPHQHQHHQHHHHMYGPQGTPRASAQNKDSTNTRLPSGTGRMSSFDNNGTMRGGEQSMFVGASPVSTAGHHASAVTLGAGVFGNASNKRRGGGGHDEDDSGMGTEFDPERSLGRLVGELGKVMGGEKLPTRPASPFSPPRSPSPLPSMHNTQGASLSFTLTRNDPLLSPPSSGGEHSGDDLHAARQAQDRSAALASAPAAPAPRRALSDSTSHNIIHKTPVVKQQAYSKTNGNRVKAIQEEIRRSASAPVRGARDQSMDVTGMTNLMATPAKGLEYGTIGRNGDVGGEGAGNIAQTLATLHARLRALETENSVSRRRVRELEDELEKARTEVEVAKQDGGKRLRDVIGEKSALEDLVQSLRRHLARLTLEVEKNKALIGELRAGSSSPKPKQAAPESPSVKSGLQALRKEIERLTKEVERLGGIVEEGLETRKKARGERTMRMEREEMEKLVRQVIVEENEVLHRAKEQRNVRLNDNGQEAAPSKLRQGLHAAASSSPTLAPPTVQPVRTRPVSHHPTPPPSEPSDDGMSSPTPVSRSNSRTSSTRRASLADDTPKTSRRRSHKPHDVAPGPSSPFPSIIAEEHEAEFFSPSRKAAPAPAPTEARGPNLQGSTRTASEEVNDLPPQTVLARVVAELEDDFVHYKAIYAELADQYKLLDPASVSAKRHVLADHLKEVIDTLEQKADQIGDLYHLLSFSDRPATTAHSNHVQAGYNREMQRGERWVGKSVGDVLRMVKDSLGDDVWERLQDDLGSGAGVGVRNRRRRSGGKEV
ncbi:hypothetical protein I316_05083 [Kwoniella heveanensis BCC8398]|uniref:Cep57 centrosome microtubule-binding domain-containing protein n=1 Tax=Kwoniella heveanensis BCC8398 TaxID=1296120 RepID=A0A1B9GQP6_9TREE|nr:hypothetical protein I316_05083 [Kwoniella heveanensis BCC8398]